MSSVTIHYRKAFFGETKRVISGEAARSGTPRGLVGRQVAWRGRQTQYRLFNKSIGMPIAKQFSSAEAVKNAKQRGMATFLRKN